MVMAVQGLSELEQGICVCGEGGGVVCTGGGRDGHPRRLISNQFDQVV